MSDEDELESYLQRRALLRSHRSYQEQLEPPPDLDRIVLRKARLALQSKPAAAKAAPAIAVLPPAVARHRPRWYGPAGVAATMLVCLTGLVDLGARALHTHTGGVTATAIHSESAEPEIPPPNVPLVAKVDTDTHAFAFEVRITAVRPRSAASASR